MVKPTVFAALSFLVCVGVVLTVLVYRRLRDVHRDVWLALGSPVFLLNVQDHWRVTRFLWSSRHSQLRDDRLSAFIISLRVVTLLVAVLFVVGVMTAR
jgi:hypothetical protein